MYDDGGLQRISHGVRRMDKNVRRVCLYRVGVWLMCEWRLVRGVVSIRSYLSHMTDKGLKNGTDYDIWISVRGGATRW